LQAKEYIFECIVLFEAPPKIQLCESQVRSVYPIGSFLRNCSGGISVPEEE
jgi:hypothetical protein